LNKIDLIGAGKLFDKYKGNIDFVPVFSKGKFPEGLYEVI
jgi:hypothetical protein